MSAQLVDTLEKKLKNKSLGKSKKIRGKTELGLSTQLSAYVRCMRRHAAKLGAGRPSNNAELMLERKKKQKRIYRQFPLPCLKLPSEPVVLSVIIIVVCIFATDDS